MLPRKQAMLRRRGAAASLGDSSKLVECFGGGRRGVSELVVKFVGEGVYVGSLAQGMGLYARCWSFVQPALSRLRSVVRRGVRVLPGLLIVDLDRMRPSG